MEIQHIKYDHKIKNLDIKEVTKAMKELSEMSNKFISEGATEIGLSYYDLAGKKMFRVTGYREDKNHE
jgi:hypothetical protein